MHKKKNCEKQGEKHTVWYSVSGENIHHENSRTFCSALLTGANAAGFLSGIISALLSALSWMSGLLSLTACSPARVMFLQKSTVTLCRLCPCRAAPSRLLSVMREQFSRCRQRSFLQLCSMGSTSWSVTCPQPERANDKRLGHLRDIEWSQSWRKEGFSFIFSHAWGQSVACAEGLGCLKKDYPSKQRCLVCSYTVFWQILFSVESENSEGA